MSFGTWIVSPLNSELNPICHLLALLGAHHILHVSRLSVKEHFNPLNAELNPIFHLLALLGTHHIFHVSRIRVKLHLQEVGCGVMDWIKLAQDMDRWRALESAVMNYRVA